MKMTKILSLVLALLMVSACFVGCPNPEKTPDFVVWVSELDGSVELAEKQIAAFQAAMGTDYYIKVEGQTEADTASKVVADVATAPDVFCFAQDQLARLIQASALAQPGNSASATVTANNDEGSVKAASNGGTLWAYPLTSDNGYYLYYDTSIVTNPDDLQAIIDDCVASGKLFRYALENAWYTASFFFATGCHSNWTMDDKGEFNAIDDNFNSEAGLIAMKGMQMLAQSSCYDSDADKFTDAAAIVTGIWNANAAAQHFGDNLGVTDLPSFTVDGEPYHLGSYRGYKLMGVKPQATEDRAEFCEELALYLTNAQSQLDRYNAFHWGPSNLEAKNDSAVKADAHLNALAKQEEFSVMQGQIHGSWWDIAKVLGADAKAATSDDMLKEALNKYDAAISAILNMDDTAKKAWGVIGNICGTDWNQDFHMTDKGNGVFESEILELHADEEFKVRQGASWDVNYGEGAAAGGANIVVPADGSYIVRLTLGADGVATALDLIPQ